MNRQGLGPPTRSRNAGTWSLVLFAFAALPVDAHHSTAMFDRTRTVELAGTIKEFQWTNPHVWVQLTVTAAAGTDEEWSIEGGGPNQLARQGWRPASFVPGDKVTLIVYPMADGAKGGSFVGARFADGRTLGRVD